MAQQCISLKGSTACPAFNQSSISTNTSLRGLFPFLAYVSDVNSFDTQFRQYITTTYSQQKYEQLLGCANVDLANTTKIYARYTATFLCNSIVQNSITPCRLDESQSRPMCADACAAFAISEETIASAPELCGTNAPNALSMIRADFTNCALPPDSLTPKCIPGFQNEPENCGFASNLPSLCAYCAASSPNATDSCCVNSRTENRCTGVHLPLTTSMGNLFPTETGKPNNSSASAQQTGGLSRGQIAGVVIGSVLGAFVLLALLIGCCILARRRQRSQTESIFNTQSPVRQGPAPPISYASSTRGAPPELPAGARVHTMAALEGTSSSNDEYSSPIGGGAYVHSSPGMDDTPESQRSGLGVATAPKRGGSLSQHSGDESSPQSNEYSSPEGLASGQSEQMSAFKDYYSQDDIRPGDVVATLWAYQPRANDEWDLERGDMLKVVGIWDDGWATGFKLQERAEDWEARRSAHRDSGVSNGSSRQVVGSAAAGDGPDGEIKAFPLVCVCLPQHWRKTIEGDTVDPSASGGGPPAGGSSP